MPPRTGTRSLDHYAAYRCVNCRHLIYASQKPGDPCLVNSLGGKVECNCTDHRAPQPQVQR